MVAAKTILLLDDPAPVREVLRVTAAHALAAVLVAIVLASPSLADHCPEEVMIGGEPERMLAGVNVYTDSYKDVIAKLGPPTSRKEITDDSDYPPGSGYATSEWKGDGHVLTVFTEFYGDKDPGGRVESLAGVMLHGFSSPYRTGLGAALGDSRRTLKQLYGKKHYRGSINGRGPDRAATTYCFEDETELEFVFNARRKVMQIYLATSAE